MRPPIFERRTTELRCDNCGHEFEGMAWHEAIQSDERGVISWVIASGNAFDGVTCPECGSNLLGKRRG